MIYIFDRNENLLEILTEYEDREIITKLNSERTLSFSCKKNKNIKKYNKAGYFKDDKFQLFIIDDPVSFKDLEEDKVSVECIHDFYCLSNTLIDDKRAKTINEAITKTLENSNYKVGIIDSFENRDINFYHISKLKALNEIIKTYKCEFDVRIEIDEITGKIKNKFIDLKHRLGSDTGLRFTYDTALESVEKSVITEGHFNVLWGWGKSLETENGGYSRKLDFADINNNKKYIENIESIEKYGRLEGIFEDSSIEDKSILLKATRERLELTKDLKLSYKATVKDISKLIGFEHFKVVLGDTIIILDEEINEIIEARVIEIIENENETILTLGNFQLALSDEDLEDVLGDLNDKIDNIPKPEIPDIDTIYPDVLPAIPAVEAKGLFSSVILTWTYENKNYYTYEVFASQIKDFMPTVDNRIFEGKASSFLHEVKPAQTWYYRVRVKNTYDKVTDFSLQVEATTKKISDGTQYFEELAIGHALIASLDLDKATVGKLTAQFLDVYNLVVKDGNDNITLRVDDFGRIYMNVTELKISSKSVETESGALAKIQEAINEYNKLIDKEFDDVITAYVDLETEMNGAFRDGVVSQSEAITIKSRISQLEKEKADIEKEFNTVYNNENLKDTTEKENLLNSYNDYVEKFRNLKETILNAITDNLINQGEITLTNDKTDLYKLSSAKFKEDFTKAIDKVGSIKSSKAETNAKNYASSEIKQTADIINSSVNKVSNAGIKNLVSYTDFEVKNLIKENWWIQGNGNWYESENANLIGFQNNYSTETMIHSNAIKDFESKVSIFADIKIENADCEIMILGSRSDELDYAYTLSALKFTTKHTQEKKWLEAITIPPNIKTLWVRIDNEGVKTGDTNKNNTIFVNALTLVNGDIARKEKILNGSEVADISIKSKEIELSVKEKVNEKELISKINMSSEKIKILSKFLELTGYATFKDLLNEGSTEINGSNIVTGILKALKIEACHFTGKNMVYIEENGILSCDGQTYIRDFFVPETHPGWNPNSRGSFSVAPSAFFDKDVHAGGEVYTKGTGVVRRENGVFIQVDAFGVQSGDPNNYLLVKAYQSNHVFGVDLWYSDEKLKENIIQLKTRPFKNVLTGLDLVKSIEHYSYNYKESVGLGTGQVDCGYIAQQLQKVNPTLVREVKQQDDSINLEPVTSAIIPHLTKAIQEQQSYIEQLETRLLKLEQLIGGK